MKSDDFAMRIGYKDFIERDKIARIHTTSCITKTFVLHRRANRLTIRSGNSDYNALLTDVLVIATILAASGLLTDANDIANMKLTARIVPISQHLCFDVVVFEYRFNYMIYFHKEIVLAPR